MLRYAFILAVVAAHPAFSQTVDVVIRPEPGLLTESGSELEIIEVNNGHRMEYRLAGDESTGPSPGSSFNVLTSWSSEQWTLLTSEEYVAAAPGYHVDVDFAAFGSEQFNMNTGRSYLLQPDVTYYISTTVPQFCDDCDPTAASIEYSVVIADPPIPGDFNLDESVDFEDFLLLSENFTRTNGYWVHGDADLNRTVDFDDFMILSENFGTTRESTAAFAVPEPSSVALVSIGLLGLALLRRRR